MRDRERERQRQREKQAPRGAGSPPPGSIPGSGDHDLSQRQPLNRLSHPGSPKAYFQIIPSLPPENSVTVHTCFLRIKGL